MGDVVIVRARCPKCGGRKVPSNGVRCIGDSRVLSYRRCHTCGEEFKTVEVGSDKVDRVVMKRD